MINLSLPNTLIEEANGLDKYHLDKAAQVWYNVVGVRRESLPNKLMNRKDGQIMDKQRVNKVAVSLTDDGVNCKITMYKTNTKLGEVTNRDIGIPPFSDTKLPNKAVYIGYCRETMINLLKNDGVEGYYYDAENHATNSGLPKKFDKNLFVQHGKDIIYSTLDPMQKSLDGKLKLFDIMDNDDDMPVSVSEYYADSTHIKYGCADFKVEFECTNDEKRQVQIPVYIKSGQLCKPKTMKIGDGEKNLTASNIMGLFTPAKESPDTKPTGPIVIKPEVAHQVVSEVKADISANLDADKNDEDEGLPLPQAPVNQEFEGDKPVVEESQPEPEPESTPEPEPAPGILDKVNKGENIGAEDWEKLKELNKNRVRPNQAQVHNVMNVLKGK